MDIYNPIKTCPKCGIDKPYTEYTKDTKRKYGISYACKDCKNKSANSSYVIILYSPKYV